MMPPINRDIDHPFLGSQQLHTITIGSPALYPAKEPRRLGCCESSGGSCHNGSSSLSLKGSFFIGSVFLQNVPYDFTQTSGQGDGCSVRALVSLVVLKVSTAIRRGADRSPSRLHQSPFQPLIAHGEQSPMKEFASGSIGRRDQSRIGRKLRRTEETFDPINFQSHHCGQNGAKAGNSPEKLDQGVLSQKRFDFSRCLFDQRIEGLQKLQVFPQNLTIHSREVQFPQVIRPSLAEDIRDRGQGDMKTIQKNVDPILQSAKRTHHLSLNGGIYAHGKADHFIAQP